MLVIGIDPGISGSICFFENGKILEVIEMPTMIDGKKNKKQVNGAQMFNEIIKKLNKDTKLAVFLMAKKNLLLQDTEKENLRQEKEIKKLKKEEGLHTPSSTDQRSAGASTRPTRSLGRDPKSTLTRATSRHG